MPNLAAIFIPATCTEVSTIAFFGVSDLIIYAPSGSNAETYANANGFDFISITPKICDSFGACE